MVGNMSYVADRQTQERKLRAVRMAAASAVGNGVDPAEVLRQVEAGIAEVISMESRRQGHRTSQVPAPRSAPDELGRAASY